MQGQNAIAVPRTVAALRYVAANTGLLELVVATAVGMGRATVAGTFATIVGTQQAGLPILRIAQRVAAMDRTVFGANRKGLKSVALAVAAQGICGAVGTSQRFDLQYAQAIPIDETAKRVHLANTCLNRFVGATGAAVDRTAVSAATVATVRCGRADCTPLSCAAGGLYLANARLDDPVKAANRVVGCTACTVTGSAILRAPGARLAKCGVASAVSTARTTFVRATVAGLVTVARVISANRGGVAVSALSFVHPVHAFGTPFVFATLRVQNTHTRLYRLVVTARGALGSAAVPIAGFTAVSFGRTHVIPLCIATEGIQVANTTLDQWVLATGSRMGETATAGASTTVLVAVGAGFLIASVANPVAAWKIRVGRIDQPITIIVQLVAARLDDLVPRVIGEVVLLAAVIPLSPLAQGRWTHGS